MSGFYTGKFGGEGKSTPQTCKMKCERTAKGMIRPSGNFTTTAISVAKANMYNRQCRKACDKKSTKSSNKKK